MKGFGFAILLCVLTTAGFTGTSKGQDEALPGTPIEYRPFYVEKWKAKSQSTRMIPWEGKRVVLLTTTANFDRRVMARILERLDGGWQLYSDLVGKTPQIHNAHDGKVTIAAVPDASFTCGVGCGYIGVGGIEVGGFYDWDYPTVVRDRDGFSHYFFYEMGRNYFTFGNRHSAFTTGFSVFMRYVCMDALECKDRETGVRAAIEKAEAELARTDFAFMRAFTTVGGLDEATNRLKNLHPSDQPSLYASVMLKLRREHGGNEWVKRFFSYLWKCPPVPWEPDPKDAALAQSMNWLIAASCAARQDLSGVFADRWRMPLGKRTRAALAAIDWKQPDLSPVQIIGSLPADELPAVFKATLSKFLTPEQRATNRRAAKWALEAGGRTTVEIDGVELRVNGSADLPGGPFKVSGIRFEWGNKNVTDDALKAIEGLSGLRQLTLGGAGDLGDAGLTHMKGLTALTGLNLDNTRVSDAGLESLAGLPNLETLTLNSTRVTDRGVGRLKDLKRLKVLWLSHTSVTDAGLAPLAGLPKLEILQVAQTKTTDDGLTRLKLALPNLRVDR